MNRQVHCLTTSMVTLALCVLAGCAKTGTPEVEHSSYETPEAAAAALITALEKNNTVELRHLLGPGTEDLLSSGDEVLDRNARDAFLARYRSHHTWVAGGPDDLVLQVGTDAWPMPIPLVREKGRWRFNGAAGAAELVNRRIGANELRILDVMHGFIAAQAEYAAGAHNGLEAGVYAQKLRSDPGKRDGLYWEPMPGEPQSPAGPLLASATAEGYSTAGGGGSPYHGYVFKLLYSQGPEANGGARDYFENGKLTGGVALLAWPVEYGVSGIMTFMINQDDVIWQRDLGPGTAQNVLEIHVFNPDSSWTPIAPEMRSAAAMGP